MYTSASVLAESGQQTCKTVILAGTDGAQTSSTPSNDIVLIGRNNRQHLRLHSNRDADDGMFPESGWLTVPLTCQVQRILLLLVDHFKYTRVRR